MIKTGTANWTVVAVALLFAAACGKKEGGAPTPVLSAPTAVEKVPAQAEVKASSGPIELSLLLRETRIKAGESIWQQIRIKNIGGEKIIVGDPIFFNPRELRKQSGSRYGTYLEAIGPDGKAMEVEYRTSAHQGNDLVLDRVSGFLEVEGPEEQAMLDGWKKQGLSLREINAKLLDYNLKKRDTAAARQRQPAVELLPGQSIETKYAFFYSMQDKIHNRSIPRPTGDFAQADFFVLEDPGEYRIRAVYERTPTQELNRIRGDMSIPSWEVLVRTPWIKLEVVK